MNELNHNVKVWLHSQQDWLQEVVEVILDKRELNEEDIKKFTERIKTDDGQRITKNRRFDAIVEENSIPIELKLTSISNIHGIENLTPKKPLCFGEENLNVIYGSNGSGKSSYSKIIKWVIGKPRASKIRSNVFQPSPKYQKFDISYITSNEPQNKTWFIDENPINHLRGIDVFDSDEALHYLNKESPATYTPPLVNMFESLAKTCDLIKSNLQSQQNNLISKLPTIPEKYKSTDSAIFISSLKPNTTNESFTKETTWEQKDAQELSSLTERLKEVDPHTKAKQLRITKNQVELFLKKIKQATISYGQENLEHIDNLKKDANKKSQIASEAALTINNDLKGIGSETWKAMWEAARIYSQELAYPSKKYPVLDDAKCVLCHQELSTDTKTRMYEFEKFIQGEMEVSAKKSKDLYLNSLNNLPLIQTIEQIDTQCEAAGLDEYWKELAITFWRLAEKIRNNLFDELYSGTLPTLIDFSDNEKKLQEHIIHLETLACQYEKDAQSLNRSILEKEKLNLEARYWASQHATKINDEIQRLKLSKQYEKWKSFANSRSVSNQASLIADTIITEAYTQRFNKELISLGATRLKVELVKTKAQKGKSLHKIQLKSTEFNVPIDSILSEGERRIIALAAFLADVTNKPYMAPFIFDDPISSLDQIWEERTIERLVELSKTRQVIVFTHRLSMLGILTDKADEIHTIHIKQEPWGAGEAGEVPLYGKKPEAALKKLQNERVPKARKVYEEYGQGEYYPLAKAICSDLRILTERIVECVFLADVIQRHRRAVNTQGKIHQLAKICIDDCNLIEEIMTKYSCYEHSQSFEAPVELPTPDELNIDISRLLSWHSEFSKRPLK